MNENRYYVGVDAWSRRSDGRLVRYRCFRVEPEGKFCVQSADFYSPPFSHRQSAQLDQQFLELLSEEPPEQRAELFDSLVEAIKHHEEEFEWSDRNDSGVAD